MRFIGRLNLNSIEKKNNEYRLCTTEGEILGMRVILKTVKNICLDLFSMFKGFTYGFLMVGLFIIIGGALLYGVLYLKNIVL